MSGFGPLSVLLVLAASLLAQPAIAEAAGAPAAGPPNIVLIISDDHGWTDYGFMGHEHVRTPNLDRLASQSLTFKRGYVPASLCCPSLASIITGQYPHQHKVTSNDPPATKGQGRNAPGFAQGRETMNRFMDAAPALPRTLAERGYVSFQAGKWWQGDFRRGGFTHGMTAKGSRHGDEGLTIGRETMQPVFDFMDGAKRDGKPFLVWYAPMLPHTPHTPPARILEKYRDKTPSERVAKYWAMIEWFDETCGALLDRLDRQGLADNTIVVYVTDNGWIQDPETAKFDPRSKQSPYDGGVRTPIMIRWPGKAAPRTHDNELASSIDLAPTLLQAAGLAPAAGMPGINLLDEAAVKARQTLFGECFTHDAVDLNDPSASLRWRWVIDDNWKLIAPHARNEPNAKPELYDLSKDPHERTNLAAQDPQRVEAMTRQLDQWWTPGR